MSAQEKLQRAIEATIAAGYQLNSEAFEFLIQNAETNDPVTIMNLALERIEALQDKPMFIERDFLEALLQQPASSICHRRDTSARATIQLQNQVITQPNCSHSKNIKHSTKPSFILRQRYTVRPQNPR